MPLLRDVLAAAKRRFPRTAEVVRYLRPKMFRERAKLRGKSAQQVFEMIHDENWWLSPESKSGWGSTLEWTKGLRDQLPGLWSDLGVASVLDAPCGDFNWMRHVGPISDGSVRYIGGDIVPKLIDDLNASDASPTRRFVHLNIIDDRLPDADMFFCRDCLIHLSHADIAKVFRNIAASNFRYVAITDFPQVALNPDILTGSVRATNLRKPPFNLPEPVREIADKGGWEPSRKVLGVWSIDQVRAAAGRSR
jgi:hypothetical protein